MAMVLKGSFQDVQNRGIIQMKPLHIQGTSTSEPKSFTVLVLDLVQSLEAAVGILA